MDSSPQEKNQERKRGSNMIITLTWISIFLLLYLIYLFLTKDIKGKELRIVAIIFLMLYFYQYDSTFNDYKDVIQKFYLQKEEVCDMSQVWSDCNTTYTMQNNTYTQIYSAFLEKQMTYMDIISPMAYGVIIFILWSMIQDIIGYLYSTGLIKK